MQAQRQPTRSRRTSGFSPAIELLVPVSVTLVVAHLLLRAWTLSVNWFYYDDFFLIQEGSSPSALTRLFEPYSGHLLPGARLIAWMLGNNGGLNWGMASAITLLMEAAVAAGALWMLLTLFGRRWGIVAPLALYLTSAFTMPSMLWWSAAVLALPTQVSFFWGVGCFVRYLRTREWSWLGYTILAVGFGLAFDVRALLVVPVLVFIALAYFSTGNPTRRLASLGRIWPAVAIGGAVSLSYVAAYTTYVPQPFAPGNWSIVREMVTSMFLTAFPVGLAGGPWRWDDALLVPEPPQWAVWLSWVAVLIVPAVAFVTRRRTLRAWIPALFLLGSIFVLLCVSRAPALGAVVGLNYRFYGEVMCAVVLGCGLAFMELHGATESSTSRPAPLVPVAAPQWLLPAVAVGVMASGTYSTISYAQAFHDANAGHDYFDRAVADLDRVGNADLVDQVLPQPVMGFIFVPDNTTAAMLPMMTDHARFPESAPVLSMLDETGQVRAVEIDAGVVSEEGPDQGCGWRITEAGRTIPLTGEAFDYEWWLRIGYLSSSDSPVRITAGDSTVDTMVLAGLNDLFVRVESSFDSIQFSGLTSDATLCVDVVEVGNPEPGDPR
ncbi:hypothetical protein [Nocardioides sp.]|uniref:hypothetical protein n=1 Tax=Nocardioides sp. TaxID=35761 RepID=UPI002C776D8C|nr:hypothetical protein [Nocardioides sp.]HXH79144.1 hypothetical protein [Nocardioides sp.]